MIPGLMDALPPQGWSEMATKADIQVVRSEQQVLRHELEAAEARVLIQVAKSETRLLRAYFLGTVGLVLGLATVPQIAERLFG